MKKICFFSSDARPLYKKDVFRAMSYPKDYIIHFRYQPLHINEDITTLANKPGIILFSIGNDLTIEESNRVITHVSIREVTIHAVEQADDTGLVHFYLRLGDFKKIGISNNPATILPPNKLVTELELTDGPTVKWHQIIDLIKSSFPNQLFYRFQLRQNQGNRVLLPQYNHSEKQSFYKLADESSYSLEMAFYDTEPSSSNNYHSLKITPINENLVKVVAPSTIDIEARRDNRTYSIFTQTISASGDFTYINFETLLKSAVQSTPQEDKAIVDTTLKIEVVKNSNRTLAFAFYSILAATAVAYAKLLSDKTDINGSFNPLLAFQYLIPLVLGFFSAYNLYRLFDKK